VGGTRGTHGGGGMDTEIRTSSMVQEETEISVIGERTLEATGIVEN